MKHDETKRESCDTPKYDIFSLNNTQRCKYERIFSLSSILARLKFWYVASIEVPHIHLPTKIVQ